ncbi:methylase involved in ubiquinone menaquinone biosynthesis [Lasius niger]|uniref:Methylase involved in ubiquinone menaquinone biosynthesis n=1 Tax=Lasius niger TaxID=67767 RepID=A0A0J7KHZ4_LASNI|nr:methylase involved in ubiquinone menaquinone biosynthesis [Lasius niger]
METNVMKVDIVPDISIGLPLMALYFLSKLIKFDELKNIEKIFIFIREIGLPVSKRADIEQSLSFIDNTMTIELLVKILLQLPEDTKATTLSVLFSMCWDFSDSFFFNLKQSSFE